MKEHVQLQQDLEKYTEKELAKIAQARKSLPTKSSSILQEGWSARQAAPGESEDRIWEEKMKNVKPIPELHYKLRHGGALERTTEEDCKCIVL